MRWRDQEPEIDVEDPLGGFEPNYSFGPWFGPAVIGAIFVSGGAWTLGCCVVAALFHHFIETN